MLTAGYNGDGLRAWKQTATGRRYYLYDGEELVYELDAAGNAVAPVVFGANGLIAYGSFIYQFDPQGNTAHLLDDDGRTVLANLAYDAGGQLISGFNPTPYGYKAQWGYCTDAESGILLLTHRYLDPATGRFLTRDPIGIEGGVNLYAYVGNGVVVKADPRGTFVLPPPVLVACGAACLWTLGCILHNWKACWNDPDIKWAEQPCIGFRPRPGKPRGFLERLMLTLECVAQKCCGKEGPWLRVAACWGCITCILTELAPVVGPIRVPVPGWGGAGALVPAAASAMRTPSGQLIVSPGWRW